MQKNNFSSQHVATLLRIGLGLVMFSGGLAKLSKLLWPSTQQALVNTYTSSIGYINQFFLDYLFSNEILTPWIFLTALSWFELLAGLLLIIGLGVRPLSMTFGLMLWSFIIALPVVTTPGVEVSVKTYTSPALLVQIRDVALSGMMFTLYNLGSGIWSLDHKLFGDKTSAVTADWKSMGLLLRLSLGIVFLVGGAFYGLDHIKSFAPAWLMLIVGILLIEGQLARYAGYAATAVLGWYMISNLSLDKSIIGNLNGIKREFALLAAAVVISQLGGGHRFTIKSFFASKRTLSQTQNGRSQRVTVMADK